MQEVVDATLLEIVETSIERNKSLQMLFIHTDHDDVLDTILKGTRGNASLLIWLLALEAPSNFHHKVCHNTAAA